MISKELVDLLILKRRIRLDQLLIDLKLFQQDGQGRIIPNLNRRNLLKELDSFMYTLDFLLNEKGYIETSTPINLEDLSFVGYTISQNPETEVSHIRFVENYFAGRLGETYVVTPKLFQYRDRDYQTQDQKQNRDARWFAIWAAIISASLTAILTTLLQMIFVSYANASIDTKVITSKSFSLYWIIFWAFAVAHSVYYGIRCFDIHALTSPAQNIYHRCAEYLFNGIGAFIGWIALYFLICLPWSNPQGFGWQHFLLTYISFMGITGHLPFVAKFGFVKH